MKLIKLKIIEADTCGGLLNGLVVPFREGDFDSNVFSPLCLIGPNGTGKSQVLQIIAEIFQLAFYKFDPDKERKEKVNSSLEFELDYSLVDKSGESPKYRLFSQKKGKSISLDLYQLLEGEWQEVKKVEPDIHLPSLVVAYTSGDNETLSRPFYASRGRYAQAVAHSALPSGDKGEKIRDPRLMLIDYGTSLEVLIANLLQNEESAKAFLLEEPNLKSLHSFRCVIQLNHSRAPGKNGIQITDELQKSIDCLKRCSTCYSTDKDRRIYTFDFLLVADSYTAFDYFWNKNTLNLYNSFHKLSMLNDLMIQGKGVFNLDPYKAGFSKRLVEPVDDDKVFRFENIRFFSKKANKPVDYVSLSDGEHQLAQLLGMLCMVNYQNVLFLLDEPESHFNPRWRVEFISKIMRLPTSSGVRNEVSQVAKQDCLITTHSPFVPSDMKSRNVLVFKKDDNTRKITVRRPKIETFGSTFDTILEECFFISPPISDIPRLKIEELLKSDNIEEIKQAMHGLGDSVARMYLADRVRQLKAKGGAGA